MPLKAPAYWRGYFSRIPAPIRGDQECGRHQSPADQTLDEERHETPSTHEERQIESRVETGRRLNRQQDIQPDEQGKQHSDQRSGDHGLSQVAEYPAGVVLVQQGSGSHGQETDSGNVQQASRLAQGATEAGQEPDQQGSRQVKHRSGDQIGDGREERDRGRRRVTAQQWMRPGHVKRKEPAEEQRSPGQDDENSPLDAGHGPQGSKSATLKEADCQNDRADEK